VPVVFRRSQNFDKTIGGYQHLLKKLEQFILFKSENPTQSFGNSDKPFASGGYFGRAVPGIAHAHLNRDVSIVYRVHGGEPMVIDLYGFYTHADLGTGNPANFRRQDQAATKLSNTSFPDPMPKQATPPPMRPSKNNTKHKRKK